MKTIVIGGQIDRDEVAQIVSEIASDRFNVVVKNDLDAAMMVTSNQADYYIGACNTGGGGALAMAIALIGANKCATISMPGNIMSEDDIKKNVEDGKIAFGFTAQDKQVVLPLLLKYLK
ncbi:MAG: DUF2620 domain-containing protein [Bacilli bacterium]